MPALRERGDDILLLARHMLERHGRQRDSLSPSAEQALMRYRFPGNVRELENMLERAVTLCPSGQISEDVLSLRPSVTDTETPAEPTGTSVVRFRMWKRQAIIEALEKTRYNKTAAAKLLGCRFGSCATASRSSASNNRQNSARRNGGAVTQNVTL